MKKGVTMFSLGEKVVYPGCGVAKISRIIEKKIGPKSIQFFELKFVNKEMTILVPISNACIIGIRKLSSQDIINHVCKMLAEPIGTISHDTMATNWNKRNKDYQGRLRTGDLNEICTIYRDLKHIERYKELSFGEKNLLSQTESLLVEEIALVRNIDEDQAAQYLRSIISAIPLSDVRTQKNINVV